MTLDEKIAEAEREMAEARDDMQHADKDIMAIRRARWIPAHSRYADWLEERDRLRALKSGDAVTRTPAEVPQGERGEGTR